MTTSTYAPAPSATFPSIYGQPGFYGQPGYEQQGFGQSPIGYGFPQLFGQQFGVPQQFGGAQQFGGPQQLGIPQQFGGSDQVSIALQVLPQLLWAAQQNMVAALHLTQQLVQQITQQYGRPGFGELPGARQHARPYAMSPYGMSW
jgi:hypothetical protein